jgi:hypothetical protein
VIHAHPDVALATRVLTRSHDLPIGYVATLSLFVHPHNKTPPPHACADGASARIVCELGVFVHHHVLSTQSHTPSRRQLTRPMFKTFCRIGFVDNISFRSIRTTRRQHPMHVLVELVLQYIVH